MCSHNLELLVDDMSNSFDPLIPVVQLLFLLLVVSVQLINIYNSFQDAMGHAIGDWDNDGNLDWFSSAIWHNRTECSVAGCTFDNSGNVLFRNLGGRQFEDATEQVLT